MAELAAQRVPAGGLQPGAEQRGGPGRDGESQSPSLCPRVGPRGLARRCSPPHAGRPGAVHDPPSPGQPQPQPRAQAAPRLPTHPAQPRPRHVGSARASRLRGARGLKLAGPRGAGKPSPVTRARKQRPRHVGAGVLARAGARPGGGSSGSGGGSLSAPTAAGGSEAAPRCSFFISMVPWECSRPAPFLRAVPPTWKPACAAFCSLRRPNLKARLEAGGMSSSSADRTGVTVDSKLGRTGPCALVAKKVKGILGCRSRSVAPRSGEAILLLGSTLVRPQRECQLQKG